MRLAPHLHRIGNDIIAAYLVESADGITVIDAGLAGHYRDLRAELAAMHRDFSDVRGVVLTHGDSDHIGFAERLRTELAIPVYVHEADAARARGEESTHPSWGKVRLGPTLGFVAYSIRKNGFATKPLKEVATVRGGDVLDLPGRPRIVELPGHSAGSIGIVVDEVSAVFVGDALTTRNVLTGARGPLPAPFTDDVAAASASHALLGELEAEWVLPGHGTPWHGGTVELARLLAEADAA